LPFGDRIYELLAAHLGFIPKAGAEMPVRQGSRQPSPGSLGFLLAVRATVATREYLARAVTSIVNHPITEVPRVHNAEMVPKTVDHDDIKTKWELLAQLAVPDRLALHPTSEPP
jgi:hypothetical protein